MIKINNYKKNQVVRALSELFEPFVLSNLKKEHHTFFGYRCSDYPNLQTLAILNKFNINKYKHNKLFQEYWTAIDIIIIKINEMPEFIKTKE